MMMMVMMIVMMMVIVKVMVITMMMMMMVVGSFAQIGLYAGTACLGFFISWQVETQTFLNSS